MLNFLSRFNRSLSTLKKNKPQIKPKKHKYDIENERWVKTENKENDYITIYTVRKIKKK